VLAVRTRGDEMLGARRPWLSVRRRVRGWAWVTAVLTAVLVAIPTVADAPRASARTGFAEDTAVAAAARAPAADTDIVFSIDGSGSIDATDFDTEKRAIVSALRNSDLFPVDGTVAVGVVQWAGGRVVDEVPLRLLSSAEDLAAVAAGIDGVSQLGGGTNTGDGIVAAAGMVSGGARAGARQTICVTTDGTVNTGIGLPEARAEAESRGVDRLAFATLEDPGFSEAVARAEYGPIALDAEVAHSRSPSEFSAVLPTACLRPTLKLVALEPNQGVQDWAASVPMIAGRETFVRAFLEPGDPDASYPVGLRLRGYRDGAELPASPLVAVNSGGLVNAAGSVTGRRGDPAASLNFRLPTDWRTGSVELRLDSAGAAIQCQEAAGPAANDCAVTADFRATTPPEITFVAMPFRRGLGFVGPSDRDLIEQAERVYSAMPVSGLSYAYTRLRVGFLGGAPSEDEAVQRLQLARTLDGCWSSCSRIYYGVLSGDDGGGLAEGIPGHTAIGYIGTPPYARNRATHEIGHLLGRPHAVRGPASGRPPLRRGVCGRDAQHREAAAADAEEFPFFGSVGGVDRATLGPLGDANSEPWGVDIRHFPARSGLGVINPHQVFELMSYCPGSGEQGLWPSTHTWRKLIAALGGPATASPAAVRAQAAASEHLVVQGTVDTATGDMTLLPAIAVTASDTPDVPPGQYTLVQVDAGGGELGSVTFAPSELHRDAPGPGGAAEPTTAVFSVPIAPQPQLARIEIRRDGQTVAARSASANEPTVHITSPQSGAAISGDLEVTWDGSDPDGNQLAYTTQYSPDDGLTWRTLSVLQEERRLVIPASELAGSDTGAVRVTASDGLRSTSDVVRFLRVPDNAPLVDITSPDEGAVFSGAQPVTLTASALDREDGQLDGDRIRWSSDRDGDLGTGAQLTVLASDLQEGRHTITVTAADTRGQTSTDQATIEVQRVAQPTNTPPAVTEVAIAGGLPLAGSPAMLRVSFTDPDDDEHTVTVDWGDASGPTMVTVPHGERTLEVSHTWAEAGTYPVSVTVSDGTATGSASVDVAVAQQGGGARVASLSSSPAGCGHLTPGAPVVLSGGVRGASGPVQVKVSWRDGTTSTVNLPGAGRFQVSHRYRKGGLWRVRAVVAGVPRSARSISVAVTGARLVGSKVSLVGTRRVDRVVLRREGRWLVLTAPFVQDGERRYLADNVRAVTGDLCAGRNSMVIGKGIRIRIAVAHAKVRRL
jgi:hypothetical protein